MVKPPVPPVSSDAVEERDALLHALLVHGPYMAITIDAHYRILSINRVVEGMRAEDMIGTSALAYMPPENHAQVRSAIDAVLHSGKAGQFDTGGLVADGSFGWWVTHVLPVTGHTGPTRAILLTIDVTAARHAEEALRTSEARYRALVEASADVPYRMGPDWTEMRHLDGQDFIADRHAPGRTWLEQYIPPSDREDVRAAIDEAIRERRPFELEHRVQRGDGSIGWARSRAVPMKDDLGTITEWVGTATDITAHRAAQHALAESEERLRYALDAAEEGLWDWNMVTDECYFSPAYHAMLGYSTGSIRQDLAAVQDLMHPDDLAVATQGPGLLRDPGQFILRFRLRSAKGDYRWIESRGKTVQRDASGQPLRAVGTHLDITERLRLEEALRRNEALLRSIIEGTTDAIFVKDREGRYLLVNQAACTVIGRPAAEILGRDATAFLNPQDARAMMALDRQLMAEGRVVSANETLTWFDGQPRHFLTTKGPLFDETAQVVGMFGIARDVTELLRQEAAQRQALEDSRSLLDLALAGAELGTWDADLVGQTARYDDRYLAMLGYDRNEMPSTLDGWEQLQHPDDAPAVREAIRAHEAGETRLYESEHRVRHRDGHWVWMLARGKVLRGADGRPVRAVGTALDITDRKRMATEGTALLKKIEALIRGLEPHGAAPAPAHDDVEASAKHQVRLSGRSREVLGLLSAGHTAAEIADRLGISKETANTHRRNLMRKLGLRNKAELIRYAIENGIGIRNPTRSQP